LMPRVVKKAETSALTAKGSAEEVSKRARSNDPTEKDAIEKRNGAGKRKRRVKKRDFTEADKKEERKIGRIIKKIVHFSEEAGQGTFSTSTLMERTSSRRKGLRKREKHPCHIWLGGKGGDGGARLS